MLTLKEMEDGKPDKWMNDVDWSMPRHLARLDPFVDPPIPIAKFGSPEEVDVARRVAAANFSKNTHEGDDIRAYMIRRYLEDLNG